MKLRPLSLIDGKITEVRGDQSLTSNNFSYKRVELGEVVVIPEHQQMLLSAPLEVFGELRVLGDVVFVDLVDDDTPTPPVVLPDDNFSYFRVGAGETKTIPQSQQMIVSGPLEVLGTLEILGETVLIEAHQEFIPPDPVLFEDNHSYARINVGVTKKVLADQQMLLTGPLVVNGTLTLEGEAVLLDASADAEDDYLPPFVIEAGQRFKVGSNRLLNIPLYFRNFGTLELNGLFILGGS